MKKMVEQNTINKSNALFEGMTADANGNVTVGKNLEVDGTVIINTATDLKTKDGSTFGGSKLYQHNMHCSETSSDGSYKSELYFSIINSDPNPFVGSANVFNYLKSSKYGFIITTGTTGDANTKANILFMRGSNANIQVAYTTPAIDTVKYHNILLNDFTFWTDTVVEL